MGESESQYVPPEYSQEAAPEGIIEDEKSEVAARVTAHSREFDEDTRNNSLYPDAREGFREEKWTVGDAQVQAVGLAHLPETFLVARGEIERAIENADIVVNEYAPEALGFYNDARMTEQLERRMGIGLFHHEIELLAAKYNKDMAVFDLTQGKSHGQSVDLDDLGSIPFPRPHESVEYKRMLSSGLKEGGQSLGAAIIATWGLAPFARWISNGDRKMSRRDFIKVLGSAAASVALGHSALKGFLRDREAPVAPATSTDLAADPLEIQRKFAQIEYLRDPVIANSLQRLAHDGYKNIAFVYGGKHLPKVKRYLDTPQECQEELTAYRDLINRYNPDIFKVFRLEQGDNRSERFVASRDLVWERIDQELVEK